MYNTKTNYSLILPQGCKPCGAGRFLAFICRGLIICLFGLVILFTEKIKGLTLIEIKKIK